MEEIQNSKKRLNQTDVAHVIVEAISSLNLSQDEIIKITERLKLLTVALSKNRTWHAYKFLDHESRIPNTEMSVEKELENSFKRNNLTVALSVLDFEGRFFVSVSKRASPKTKGATIHYFNPTFFIFEPKTYYFFASKLIIDNLFLICFCKGLGYANFKECELSSNNTPDMLRMLYYKEKRLQSIDYVKPEMEHTVQVDENGTDYTQKNNRKKYAEQMYGKTPPKLQKLTFEVNNYRCDSGVLEGKMFSSRLQFTAPDVLDMVKGMIAEDCIATPVPDYLQNILHKGKNIFQTKKDE